MTDSVSIALTGAQTIATSATTRQLLLSALNQHAELRIDCTAVTEADLTLLQLLLAVRLSAERHGKRLSLVGARRGGLGTVLVDAGYALCDGLSPESTFLSGEDEG